MTTLLVLIVVVLLAVALWQLTKIFDLTQVGGGNVNDTQIANDNDNKVNGYLMFAFLGAAILGSLGLIAGIWADKYDQLAAFQNFIIMPATMLSGVFYSIHSLPSAWQVVSHFNPFFYMIDGFRYGFFGVSDISPWDSLAIVACFFVVVSAIALRLLQKGYKLRN